MEDEKGAALIIVLGLVAVIAGWAATAAYEDMVSIRRSENMQVSMKAELACLSALKFAKVLLKRDAASGKYDSLNEIWAQSTPPFPVDEGMVTGRIIDANRFLDLNALVTASGKVDDTMAGIARRLFIAKDIDPKLVDAVVDWIDKDSTQTPLGFDEDASYAQKEYRVKNSPMDRINELRLIAGITANDVQALREVATVWPTQKERSRININTVRGDVLLAMFPAMTRSDLENVKNNRPYVGLNSLKAAVWAQSDESKQVFLLLSVSSNNFFIKTHAVFGRANWREQYAVSRSSIGIEQLWRERVL